MGIRKLILFFQFFVFLFLLTCHQHLATESVTAASTEWIKKQINGTVNMCKDILGTKWKDHIAKTHDQCTTLTVWVNNPTFTEFVDVNKDGVLKGGFSVAVFCLALQELPFKIQPIFEPPINESYNKLVKKLKGKCEAVGGDISITSNRTKDVDFTIAYMSSEIYMLVPAVRKWNQTMMTLTKPFTTRLWVSIISACIFNGVAIGILEYRKKNPIFYEVPFYQKLLMIIWFPVSKFFLQEGRIYNRCSKVVLVIWLITIFIVMQIFTACLSSWLTLNQLQPKVPKQYQVVGYQSGSFVIDLVKNHVQGSWSEDKGLPLSSLDDYKNVLDKGIADAIFDERPYLDVFLQKYGENYMKVGPVAGESGLGFAFSIESPLQPEFSRAIVKVTESPDMMDLKKKYLGIKTPPTPTQQADSFPERLDIHSFFLLFVFMGLATIIAIIYSEIKLVLTTAQIVPETSRNIISLVQTISANSQQIAETEH